MQERQRKGKSLLSSPPRDELGLRYLFTILPSEPLLCLDLLCNVDSLLQQARIFTPQCIPHEQTQQPQQQQQTDRNASESNEWT
jgi:hypothetical protein